MQQPQGEFLEINDLLGGNNVVEEIMLAQNVLGMDPEEQALMKLADEEMQVQVPLLPEEPLKLLDEEIPLDQLVDFDDIDLEELGGEQDAQPDQHEPENGNMQLNVGMVIINQVGPDPAYADWERKKATEATRVWASFFSPSNPNSTQVSIPTEWANFFIVMLMSLDNFYWAKEFLSSKAAEKVIMARRG